MGADVLKIKELIDKIPEMVNRKITFINEMQRKNKDEKISTTIGSVNNGQIIFNEEDRAFIAQVKDFAGQDFTEHDDAPDVVAQFDIDVKNIEVIRDATFLDRRLFGV
jgi:ABC-type multidrug transport system ATPase subunit